MQKWAFSKILNSPFIQVPPIATNRSFPNTESQGLLPLELLSRGRHLHIGAVSLTCLLMRSACATQSFPVLRNKRRNWLLYKEGSTSGNVLQLQCQCQFPHLIESRYENLLRNYFDSRSRCECTYFHGG